MSRTVRRKNDTWGWYYREIVDLPDGTVVRRLNFGAYPDKILTRREIYKGWSCTHGESSHRNARSPGRYYREHRERELRAESKEHLARWKKSPDEYEPMIRANPTDCWGDWL